MGTHDSHHRIGGALFGATRQSVLRILFGQTDRRFYQRQIMELAAAGSGAVQRELANLADAGILTRAKEGNQIYFQANRDSPVFPEIEGLVRKTFGIPAILQEALDPFAASIRLAFMYGSVAAGKENAASDVDVLVVGDGISLDQVVSAFSAAQQRIAREVNPSVYAVGEFRRGLAQGRHFLSSVARGPMIFLVGDERELKRLAQIRMAQGARTGPRGNRQSLQPRRSRS